LDGTIDVSRLFSTSVAFAALRSDGSIVTWGNINYGGDSTSVNSQLTSVINLANFNAVNNAPVLTMPTAINYTDTVFNDAFATATGALAASDIDGNTLTYGITGGTDNGLTISKSSAYGVLTVTKSTGVYNFAANDTEIEELKANASTGFTITASDGILSDSKSLTINIIQNGITESIGNDTLTGSSASDKFDGLAGDDVINGLAGDDIINGGLGNDILIGGLGKDTYVINVATDIVTELSQSRY
jgi:Ca2+-binding RTX toxin-like protein